MRKILLISSSLLFSSSYLVGQDMLTLSDAVALGVDKNFSVQIAQSQQIIGENNYTRGNAGFLPLVEVQANQVYQRQNVDLDIQSSDGTFNVKQDWAEAERLNTLATLQWTFFDGLGMFYSYSRLAEARDASNLNTKIEVENTIALVSEAYYQIVLEQGRLRVLEENLKISDERLRFAKSRYEVGKASKLDYLAAQVDYNSDRTALLVQEEILKNSKVDLNFFLARDVNLEYQVAQEIEIGPGLDYQAIYDDLQTSNPDLLLAIKRSDLAYYERKESWSRMMPELGFNFSYNYNTAENEAGQVRRSTFDGINYGFSASWTVFDGMNRRREFQNSVVNEDIFELEEEELRLQLQADLKKAHNRYTKSIILVDLETENLGVAKENARIALDRYELGVSNFLELREAQRNAVDAVSRLLDAQFSTKLAEIELLRLTGSTIRLLQS